MITKVCFENQWIRNKSREVKADPILIERAIYAFELLANTIDSGIKLVFKGGTGLMLLIPELKRLSIDIDIITNEKNTTLKKAFDSLVKEKEGVFTKWEEDKRHSAYKIRKKHFKFYYASPVIGKELYVLLDILQINSPFPKTIKKPLLLPIFKTEKEVKAIVPTINSLTGDKLTAFAPASIGISYGKGKSMEIIKQLFDLGVLFEYISDLKEINEIYKKIAQIEASFRNLDLSKKKFLEDSINTSFLICQLDFRGSIKNDNTRELKDGIRRIKSHIIGGKYTQLNAKEDASKVACLASLIKDNRLKIDIEKLRQTRRDIEKIKNIQLPGKFTILNKLKSISPESFYLWAVATKVI